MLVIRAILTQIQIMNSSGFRIHLGSNHIPNKLNFFSTFSSTSFLFIYWGIYYVHPEKSPPPLLTFFKTPPYFLRTFFAVIKAHINQGNKIKIFLYFYSPSLYILPCFKFFSKVSLPHGGWGVVTRIFIPVYCRVPHWCSCGQCGGVWLPTLPAAGQHIWVL